MTASRAPFTLTRLGLGFTATSRSVGQPLTLDAQERLLSPHNVVNAEPHPVVHAEIKLGEVAVQVPLVDVLVDAHQAALEEAEIALGGVGVDAPVVAVPSKLAAVIDRLVLPNPHEALVNMGSIGVNRPGFVGGSNS